MSENRSSEQVRISFSLEELEERARRYMIEMDGRPIDMKDDDQKDRWRERFGLLIHFVQYGLFDIDRQRHG